MLDELCALCEWEQSCLGNQQKAAILIFQLANLCRGMAQGVFCQEYCLLWTLSLCGPDALGSLNHLRKS